MNEKRKYQQPEIVLEIDLETKAGSPIGPCDDEIILFPGGSCDYND